MSLTDDTRRRPHRVYTISDIRVKKCWICLEEEVSGDKNTSSDWCHPCKCSLVCHGNCLLEWMNAQESTANRPNGAIKCPQCGTEYTIVSYQPRLLRLFDAVHARVVLFGAAVAVGGVVTLTGAAVFLAAAGYGAAASEAFAGENAFLLIYGRDPVNWDAYSVLDWVFVPYYLYTAGTNRSFFFNLTAILCASPITATIRHNDGSPWGFLASPIASLAVFPFLIPIRNLIYNRLQAWVTRKAASPILDLSSHRPTIRTIDNVPGMPGVVVNFVDIRGNAVARVQAVGQAPAAGIVPGPAANAGLAGNGVGAGPVGNNINRLLRGAGLGTALVKPLFIPWISKGMGSLLLGLSNYLTPLKSILFLRKRAFPLIRYRPMSSTGIGLNWTWSDLDPIWWRNSLGYAIFNVFSDGLQLWYTYLIERERQSRRVVSRDFEGLDSSSLDLIPDA